jgi:hypothetical protein
MIQLTSSTAFLIQLPLPLPCASTDLFNSPPDSTGTIHCLPHSIASSIAFMIQLAFSTGLIHSLQDSTGLFHSLSDSMASSQPS